MTILCDATMGTVRPRTAVPGYDRTRLPVGIVHLGLGAFARAHLAAYTEDALAAAPGPWGIAGVSLRRPEQRDLLGPQDGLYTALERENDGVQARVIGCVRRVAVGAEDPAAVVRMLADPGCRVVTLTVTEKGYCHDPATGRLDAAHPDIRHDLEAPSAPRSAVGVLVRGLAARRAAWLPPFTAVSCDNLPGNGLVLAGLVRDFAALCDDRLAAWVEAEGAFPSTMVDRIVPAATAADRRDAAALTGLEDAAAVSHEAYRQWVIEDRFAGARPAWEQAGAELVGDVRPWEHAKLRLLNGAHSALAYLGFLTGHETIAEAVGDPVLQAYVGALWEEVIPVVPAPPGVDLRAYCAALLRRFGNTAIRHRTAQIAMDGSQKLPQRLLGSARERLASGLPIPCLALGVAAWIRYVGGVDERGRAIAVQDPLAGVLRAALDGAVTGAQVAAVLGVRAVFGEAMPVGFAEAVTAAYCTLLRLGARGAAASVRGG